MVIIVNLGLDLSRRSEDVIAYYILKIKNYLLCDTNNIWKHVRLNDNTCDYSQSMFYNNRKDEGGDSITNLFADYFSTVYTTSGTNLPDYIRENAESLINVSKFSTQLIDFVERLSFVDIKKAPGPDRVPPFPLKKCIFSLSRPLHRIFSKSLEYGVFLHFWKSSYITPVFKSGNRSDVTNYGPISIISAIPKLLESFVTDYFSEVFKHKIVEEQHGFRRGRSTLTNLACYVEEVSDALDGGLQVDAIYIDFFKAFDKVNHHLLYGKLKSLSINGLYSYISDCTQVVKIKTFMSKM